MPLLRNYYNNSFLKVALHLEAVAPRCSVKSLS